MSPKNLWRSSWGTMADDVIQMPYSSRCIIRTGGQKIFLRKVFELIDLVFVTAVYVCPWKTEWWLKSTIDLRVCLERTWLLYMHHINMTFRTATYEQFLGKPCDVQANRWKQQLNHNVDSLKQRRTWMEVVLFVQFFSRNIPKTNGTVRTRRQEPPATFRKPDRKYRTLLHQSIQLSKLPGWGHW